MWYANHLGAYCPPIVLIAEAPETRAAYEAMGARGTVVMRTTTEYLTTYWPAVPRLLELFDSLQVRIHGCP